MSPVFFALTESLIGISRTGRKDRVAHGDQTGHVRTGGRPTPKSAKFCPSSGRPSTTKPPNFVRLSGRPRPLQIGVLFVPPTTPFLLVPSFVGTVFHDPLSHVFSARAADGQAACLTPRPDLGDRSPCFTLTMEFTGSNRVGNEAVLCGRGMSG